ncbi:MAG TPA: Ig-like domain-containing protein [Blastocatellia bacterium]|nr:Ig-like domain-containing protein [Blastocatellia bacterium]
MKKTSFGTALGVKGLSLAMILSSSLLPTYASHTKKLPTTTISPGAIGILESKGVVTINGRPANGSFTVWGDELVTATTGARIVFGALGEVNISPGASVQLKMEHAKLHEAAGSQAFSAQLLAGEMSVKLHTDSGALVNSVESEFTASKGSAFKVDLREGRAMIETNSGTVLANTTGTAPKPFENKAPSPTTKKDEQLLAAKKLEKLIGNYKLSVPTGIVAEAARRERAMDDLNQRRNAFMRSVSITSSSVFLAERTNRPVANPATPVARSIGSVESLQGMLVNGRLTSGREMLWGGETLEAPKGSGARVAFSSIGQVVLNSGAKAKLTTESVGLVTAGQSSQRVLAAQLLSGDVQVRFEPQASGYVRAGDSVMAATRGASFRVEMREGNGAVDVTNGSVMVIGNWPLIAPPVVRDGASGKTTLESKAYNIRPANLSAGFNVGVNHSHPVAMRVTDGQNKPVANVPVRFTVEGAGTLGTQVIGLSSVEVRTDARGIASVPYHATTVGTANVKAEVPGTNAQTIQRANATAQQSGFNSWQGPLPALLTLAGAVGIGLAIYATQNNRTPITGKGDALIVP